MKKKLLILASIILLESLFIPPFVLAYHKPEDCGCSTTAYMEAHLLAYPPKDDIQLKELTTEELNEVKYKLCLEVILADFSGFNASYFIGYILDALGVPRDAENANKIISAFFKKYMSKLICPKDPKDCNSREKHLFKQALFESNIDLYDEILLDDEQYQFDFNSYETLTRENVGETYAKDNEKYMGKGETLIDYIDKLIEEEIYDNDELESIREALVDRGAKKYEDL